MIRTVRDLIAALEAFPDDMPVMDVIEDQGLNWDKISDWYWHGNHDRADDPGPQS